MELKDDMKKAYSVYCCNHDEALSLLDKVTLLSSQIDSNCTCFIVVKFVKLFIPKVK